RQKPAACGRKEHAPRGALEQGYPQPFLQLADSGGERGLRDVQAAGGLGEACCLDQRDEATKQIKLNHRWYLWHHGRNSTFTYESGLTKRLTSTGNNRIGARKAGSDAFGAPRPISELQGLTFRASVTRICGPRFMAGTYGTEVHGKKQAGSVAGF